MARSLPHWQERGLTPSLWAPEKQKPEYALSEQITLQ